VADSYQQGTVRFQLPELPEGSHTMVIKAWDAANNSTEISIRFVVPKKQGLSIFNVVNYPNPFAAQTSFRFSHNRPNTTLAVTVKIFTLSGKLLKTVNETINTSGNRSSGIGWDGLDESGRAVPPAIYVYRLQVIAAGIETAVKSGKLVRL